MSERNEIRRVAVIGCGVMGSGVTEVFAAAGLDTVVVVSSPSSRRRGIERVTAQLDRGVRKGKLTGEQRSAMLDRIRFTMNLADLADRQLVLEAISEDEDAKRVLLADLGKAVAPDAVIASTTSALPIVRLAGATEAPGRVVGMHFFNPAPVLPLVEVVPSVLTDDATTDLVVAFATDVLGKQVVRSPDRAGFIVNALLVPYLLSAVRMVDEGKATAAVVDTAMTAGCGHPMGPLALIDMIGLDVMVAVADALYAEYKQPLYAPPPLLCRMADGGLLGRKSGRGFHDYG